MAEWSALGESYMDESLCGLAVGDALGELFVCLGESAGEAVRQRDLGEGEAVWTDDTLMACSVVALARAGRGLLRGHLLMDHFAAQVDPGRGYSRATAELLTAAKAKQNYRKLVGEANLRMGSWGNGAAMRVAPLGAGWCDDVGQAREMATIQARVTHGHNEACDGAVAVAVCAALVAASRGSSAPARSELLTEVAKWCQPGRVGDALRFASALDDASADEAAELLGSGQHYAAYDTVPFALWAAAGNLDDYQAGFWECASGLGDSDTTCAIAGGVIAARVGRAGVPEEWRLRVEPLPAFAGVELVTTVK